VLARLSGGSQLSSTAAATVSCVTQVSLISLERCEHAYLCQQGFLQLYCSCTPRQCFVVDLHSMCKAVATRKPAACRLQHAALCTATV
jgi:hypothetical protein